MCAGARNDGDGEAGVVKWCGECGSESMEVVGGMEVVGLGLFGALFLFGVLKLGFVGSVENDGDIVVGREKDANRTTTSRRGQEGGIEGGR